MSETPSDLSSRNILVYKVPAGTVLFRSHQIAHTPLHFGRRSLYRWDAPFGEYGVLYLAFDEYVAFMESIGRNALKTRFIPGQDLRSRGLSKVVLKRELTLVDLVSPGGLTRIGSEGSLTSSVRYENSQQWSKAFKIQVPGLDGIRYRARHDPAREAAAFYDHCADAFAVEPCQAWANLPQILGPVLDHYDFGTDL